MDLSSIVKQKEAVEHSIKQFTALMTDFSARLKKFFGHKRIFVRILGGISLILFVIVSLYAYGLYKKVSELNQKKEQLVRLSSYNVDVLRNHPYAKQALSSSETLYDLIDYQNQGIKEISTYGGYLDSLQVPYQYFMQYLFLPRLNIWKNVYTNTIDYDLVGKKFVESNVYTDVYLIKKWGEFFSQPAYVNETNEITDISVGDITETENGYFYIPVDVSFIAPSKRALMMLVDSLSLTSEKNNIILLQEFIYTLWQNIKQVSDADFSTLKKEYSALSGVLQNDDQLLGYAFYQWVYSTGQAPFITDDLIVKTIKQVVDCGKETDQKCYYLFREKYRDIPSFAYVFGTDLGKNKTQELKLFLQKMPPLFRIKEFTFDKVKGALVDTKSVRYVGKVSLQIYGKGIESTDVEEISRGLGNRCFADETMLLSPDTALSMTENMINKLSNYSKTQSLDVSNLWDLKDILTKFQTDYPVLGSYKKIVRLFEIYRMLKEAGVCVS